MEDGLLICKETLKSQEQNYLKATEICSIPSGSRFCTCLSTWLKCRIIWLKTYLRENASKILDNGRAAAVLLHYVRHFHCSPLPTLLMDPCVVSY